MRERSSSNCIVKHLLEGCVVRCSTDVSVDPLQGDIQRVEKRFGVSVHVGNNHHVAVLTCVQVGVRGREFNRHVSGVSADVCDHSRCHSCGFWARSASPPDSTEEVGRSACVRNDENANNIE